MPSIKLHVLNGIGQPIDAKLRYNCDAGVRGHYDGFAGFNIESHCWMRQRKEPLKILNIDRQGWFSKNRHFCLAINIRSVVVDYDYNYFYVSFCIHGNTLQATCEITHCHGSKYGDGPTTAWYLGEYCFSIHPVQSSTENWEIHVSLEQSCLTCFKENLNERLIAPYLNVWKQNMKKVHSSLEHLWYAPFGMSNFYPSGGPLYLDWQEESMIMLQSSSCRNQENRL